MVGHARALLVSLGAFGLACADLAGIEAGHLVIAQAGAGGAALAAGGGGAGNAGGATAGAPPNTSGGSSSGAGTGSTSGAGSAQGGNASAGSNPTGGSAGTAGSAGTGGGASACSPGMVQAFSGQGVAFCIDAYETTNAQYLAFTQQHSAATTSQVAACAGNGTFVPDTGCSSALTDIPSKNLPVVCVDWCDAQAYCASAGKRLCGRVGGTKNPPSDLAKVEADEWFAACYGPDEHVTSGTTCNDSSFDSHATAPKAASQIPDCEGGVDGLFNLSGNVAEWENACDSDSTSATCYFRGGSYQDGPFELECTSSNGTARATAVGTLGIRCCANAN